MKVILDGIPLGEIEQKQRQPGEFFSRLVGIRLSSDGNLEPLYIPLLRISCRAGQLLVEINSDRPLVYITLWARPPFINIFRFPWKTATD